jgi:hypothetical protein
MHTLRRPLLLITHISSSFCGNLMTSMLHPWMRHAAILPACLLAACSGVQLQSPAQTIQELTDSLQRDARKDCQRYISVTDYMACTERVNKAYDLFRQEQKKQKPPPIVIERPTLAVPDASVLPSHPQ